MHLLSDFLAFLCQPQKYWTRQSTLSSINVNILADTNSLCFDSALVNVTTGNVADVLDFMDFQIQDAGYRIAPDV